MTRPASAPGLRAAAAALISDWSVRLLQSGTLQDIPYAGGTWPTAIYKTPLTDRVTVDRYGIVGDQHSATERDPERALCCHPTCHYPYWRAYFRGPLPLGSFGENLTVDGLSEADLCIGDVLQCGTVLMQISQPRMPCDGPARRIGQPDLVKLTLQTGKVGFMTRVLEGGSMQVGDTLALIERPHPEIPLPFVMRVFHAADDTAAAELAALPLLAAEWRERFALRHTRAG